MTDPDVTVTLDWAVARWWDRVVCYMVPLAVDDPIVHRALLDTHHALSDAILACTCVHCGTRSTMRRSRLCDACNTYRHRFGTLPGHATLDGRDD